MIKKILFYYFIIAVLISIWQPTTIESFILIIVCLIMWWLTAPIRRERDRKRWENWNRALALAKDSNFNLGRITSIRQRARTGTKAYVRWIIGSGPSAIWIPNSWPRVWMYLLVSGGSGYGSHHNESVFYVNTLKWVLPSNTLRGWKRHEKRMRNSQKEIEKKESSYVTEPLQEAPLIKYPVSQNEEQFKFYKDPLATGSCNYFEIEPGGDLIYSEGVKRMCASLNCYWILEIIYSKFDQIYQLTVENPFHYIWSFFFIKHPKEGITLIIEDSDFNVVFQEEINERAISENIHLMVNCRIKDSRLFLPSEY